jgi:DNA helicase II / ATP-dependent DNA helicase PcrA
MPEELIAAVNTDDGVDAEISGCLDLDAPRSFFLYAGAGSGKTRSLVNAIRYLLSSSRRRLMLRNQSVAVVTYTNAAADEINRRLEFDPLVEVATIHSFAWKLISQFQSDIREWLRENLTAQLVDLNAKSSRPGSKAETDRVDKIERTSKRLASLDDIRKFTYNPNGDNRTRDSLNHTEVIAIVSTLLLGKPLMQSVMTARHPIMFIDESQDTNKSLVDALLSMEQAHAGTFSLGLFGDTMQRIYNDGKVGLEAALPDSWARPVKVMNHRSARRVVQLVNAIRADADDHRQFAVQGSAIGTVRLFIVNSEGVDVLQVEQLVCRQMSSITGDSLWLAPQPQSNGRSESPVPVKKLILEHHMAAQRLGFDGLFSSLYPLERERTSLLDGSISGLQMFIREVVPLVDAAKAGDKFAVGRLIRERSPLLTEELLRAESERDGGARELLSVAGNAAEDLVALWSGDVEPTLHEVAQKVSDLGLFDVPRDVDRVLAISPDMQQDDGDLDLELLAWRACMAVGFNEVRAYASYVAGSSPFATHQGVKGLEFPRVMVVISDEEARGFMFSYEKLFGAKALTKTDLENAQNSQETSIDRTRRLFYVTCSRAQDSLAIVAYTGSPASVRERALDRGWFTPDEIEML